MVTGKSEAGGSEDGETVGGELEGAFDDAALEGSEGVGASVGEEEMERGGEAVGASVGGEETGRGGEAAGAVGGVAVVAATTSISTFIPWLQCPGIPQMKYLFPGEESATTVLPPV